MSSAATVRFPYWASSNSSWKSTLTHARHFLNDSHLVDGGFDEPEFIDLARSAGVCLDVLGAQEGHDGGGDVGIEAEVAADAGVDDVVCGC